MMNKFIKKAVFTLLPIASMAAGCSTDIDEDAFRAGAIKMEIDEVTSDEIYPTAGDEIDWKMVFVPSPGDIIVNTFWDDPLSVFNVEVGIYDRFGIPILVQKRDTGGATGEVRAFTPETGLHYVKVSAESGQSIYSINIKFDANYDGFVAPDTAPTFEAYDLDESAISSNASKSAAARSAVNSMAASSESASGSSAPANNGDSNGGAMPANASGGVVLPSAASGGAVLPTAAVGGISSSSGDSGPTVVRTGSGSRSSGSSEVKTVNTKTAAVSTEKSSITPICSDIKGKHKKLEAEILSVTSKKKGAQFKISVGKKDGVQDGAVGEIYVDGKLLEGGRFKVEKIFESNSVVVTNASAADVKKATRIVVKTPE